MSARLAIAPADGTFAAYTAPTGRWAAVRRGAIFCAPACGFRCTWNSFRASVKRADAIVADLGPGWRPNVWENMGWHASALRLSVFDPFDPSAGVQVYDQTKDDGPHFWCSLHVGGKQFCAGGKSARAAYNKAYAEAMSTASLMLLDLARIAP